MFYTTHISHNSYSSCTSHYANKWENESMKTFEHPLSLKRFKLSVLNVLCACDEIGFYCSLLWKHQRHVFENYTHKGHDKSMINCTDGTRVIRLSFRSWSVMEKNKKENEKGKRVVYLSIDSGIWLRGYCAFVSGLLRASKWLIMKIILSIFTVCLLLFESFREVSKMWKGDLRQVYARMLHNHNQKNTYLFISFAKREEDFSNAKCTLQVLYDYCLLHPKQ